MVAWLIAKVLAYAVVFVVAAIAAFLGAMLLRYKCRYSRQFPGPNKHTLLGVMPEWIKWSRNKKIFRYFRQLAKEYGKHVEVRVLFRRVILTSDPSSIREIARNVDSCRVLEPFKTAFSVVTEGLLVLDGPTWKAHRHMLKPAFYPAQLKQLPVISHRKLDQLAKKWGTDPINLEEHYPSLTMDIIGLAGFNYDINSVEEPGNAICKAVNYGATAVQRRIPLPKFLWGVVLGDEAEFRRQNKLVEDLLLEVLHTRRRELAAGAKPKPDILGNMFLELEREDCGAFTDKELCDEMGMFFLAGHETTSHALAFTTFCLYGDHGKASIAKARAEVDRVIGDAVPTVEMVQKLEFLDACVKEALRMYPVVNFTARTLAKDLRVAGKVIKAGTGMFMDFRSVHYNEEYYPEPDRYMPERWLKDSPHRVKPGTFFAFGDGPRQCIGQAFAMIEIKTIIALMLRRYDVNILTKEIDLIQTVTMGSKELMATVRPRA